ncbi:hypothetical protein BD309DRAFT_339493 [Dichomitus squalens]|uniref:Uncharacterized protein n=1 Tax=Dichomitus squalens TaxID=114155 RepID=A0A4Q9NH88_9APHY|nr:hypothetical protein BD309DRAFT_339493 [Dichomitus squalens]TBU60536.1 hypothetical protein BD310DRAFT_321232 [Dichomitus squalens]
MVVDLPANTRSSSAGSSREASAAGNGYDKQSLHERHRGCSACYPAREHLDRIPVLNAALVALPSGCLDTVPREQASLPRMPQPSAQSPARPILNASRIPTFISTSPGSQSTSLTPSPGHFRPRPQSI